MDLFMNKLKSLIEERRVIRNEIQEKQAEEIRVDTQIKDLMDSVDGKLCVCKRCMSSGKTAIDTGYQDGQTDVVNCPVCEGLGYIIENKE